MDLPPHASCLLGGAATAHAALAEQTACTCHPFASPLLPLLQCPHHRHSRPLPSSLPPPPPIPTHFAPALQLSTATDIFLVDLLALSADPDALSAALGPTLGSERVYKLGVGLSSDVRKLGASWPRVASFRAVRGCLDLGTLWKQRHVPHSGQQQQQQQQGEQQGEAGRGSSWQGCACWLAARARHLVQEQAAAHTFPS